MLTFTPIVQVLSIVAAAAFAASPALGCGCPLSTSEIPKFIELAISDDPGQANFAIQRLRNTGSAALVPLLAQYDELVGADSTAINAAGQEKLARLGAVIDSVAKQKDAHVSRLFWHTDMRRATREAQRTGKPILSLRLLGNLDEDLSCANSRFFRTVLYANHDVSQYLRDHFVLHWQSLRPVPKLTIDFGDGRTLERTITGNSIHYVLDQHGQLVDAVPGLYGPAAFLRALQAAEAVATQAAQSPSAEHKAALLRAHHSRAADSIGVAWRVDLSTLGFHESIDATPLTAASPIGVHAGQVLAKADAVAAMPIAPTKMAVEIRPLGAMTEMPLDPLDPVADADEVLWLDIAALHAPDASLDDRSMALMRSKFSPEPAELAAQVTSAKRRVEDPFMRTLRNFQQSIALDTVRNEYVIHRQIHQWLAEEAELQPATPARLDAFNQRVYAELFLSPLDDPWMGLAPSEAYAALDGGGCR